MVNNYPRFEVKDAYSITLKVKVPGSLQRPRFDPRPVDGEQSGTGTGVAGSTSIVTSVSFHQHSAFTH
jgi:hypothetical protein